MVSYNFDLRIGFGIALTFYTCAIFFYHTFQIYHFKLPFKVYRYSLVVLLWAICDSLSLTVLQRPNLSSLECTALGKTHFVFKCIANFSLGVFYFKRRNILFENLIEKDVTSKVLWYLFLLMSAILVVLFPGFVSYIPKGEDCRINRTLIMKLSFAYLVFYKAVTSAFYLWLFAYPTWKLWGRGHPKRERILMKSTLWVGCYMVCVVIATIIYLTVKMPGIFLFVMIYTVATTCVINQYKHPQCMKNSENSSI